MAKKMYFGVGGTARRVKKIYIGVGGVAKRVKKAYIGVGGVARPCFSTELEYWGQASDISPNRHNFESAANSSYGLFGGGWNGGANDSTTTSVVAYSKSLTRSNPTGLLKPSGVSGASTDKYAVFAGGYSTQSASSVGKVTDYLYTYDTSLTRKQLSAALSDVRYGMASVSVDGVVFFGGGSRYSGNTVATVDIFNSSFTRIVSTKLSKVRVRMGAARAGKYAIFAAGGAGYSDYSDMDIFDTSGTKIEADISLSVAKKGFSAVTLNDCAMFAGGYYETSIAEYLVQNTEVIDGSLTLTAVTSLSEARYNIRSAAVGDFAMFVAGSKSSAIDVYDTAFTRTNKFTDSMAARRMGSVSFAGYALFAGRVGEYDIETMTTYMDYKVDVYTA